MRNFRTGPMRMRIDDSVIIKKFSDSYGNTCVIHGFDASGNMILETHSIINHDNGQELDTPNSNFVAINPEVAIELIRMMMENLTIHKASF